LLVNPELPNDRLISDEVHFHFHCTVNKQTFVTRQLQISTNFINVPFVTQKLHFGMMFCPEESELHFFENEDGQAIAVTSQTHTEMINVFLAPKLPPNHNLWSQQNGSTAHTAVISMMRFAFCFRSGRFLVAVMCHGLLVRQTSQHLIFSVGLFDK
jgi:hypothetical protein